MRMEHDSERPTTRSTVGATKISTRSVNSPRKNLIKMMGKARPTARMQT